ncbi:glutamine-hydrolyzing GMP synthase [Alphaproteobacteria bacterium]|nr:glutamine-hydrolyzing GMP synthase [Alphaproteobacteria bacterium]MDC1022982.1 glutamine-hydrolyzing GMP synthase [Alphaproteobacteria bacterium]
MKNDIVLIVDFGSQVTQLIARRLRELKVYCEIHPYSKINIDLTNKLNPKAIILSGGPASVLDDDYPRPPKNIFEMGVPILGICYGQQVMMKMLGGEVTSGSGTSEFGKSYVKQKNQKIELLEGLFNNHKTEQVWMSHGDHVSAIPNNFKVFGASENAPFAIIGDNKKHFYAVQFHPEVVHTLNGKILIKNFLDLADISFDWTMQAFREEAINEIKNIVGEKKVICALSGGVDSSVTAILIHKAIGEQLTCIYVDNGLMRKKESEEVIKLYKDHFKLNLVSVHEENLFLSNLNGISDPEEKRKIIGKLFIEIFEKEALKIGDVSFLAQGTLYPDVIESISFSGGPSVTIKSHHNVGGLPDIMNLKLIEPLKELFKDEVRTLGRELDIPEDFIQRHPFPGPGLAIRCPGEITSEKLDILRNADAIYIDQIKKHGLYNKIWQAFTVILPVKTVGVMGDSRTYDYVCALRAVTSIDGMTADYYPFEHEFLSETATKIINNVNGINRVTYDITSKPPGTIEWE